MIKPAHSLRFVVLAIIMAGASMLPDTAAAQLSKLKKAAADAAKDKAGVKAEAPTASSSDNFVITADRLAAVMAQMETGMERAGRDAAAKAARSDYDARHKTFEACIETQTNAMESQAPSIAGMQKGAAAMEQMGKYSDRIQAAQKAKRYREYVALTDTMTIGSLRSSLMMYGLETKCPPAYMPPALVDDAAAKMDRMNQADDGSNTQTIAPTQRAGMTTRQFGMVRERAALWALQQTNNAPVGNNKYSVFTTDEQVVLDAQGAKLKKWAPLFKSSPSTWVSWGDIKSW